MRLMFWGSTQTHGGLQIFINRLESEVEACRREQPYEIRPPAAAPPAPQALPAGGGGGESAESESDSMDVDPSVTATGAAGAFLSHQVVSTNDTLHVLASLVLHDLISTLAFIPSTDHCYISRVLKT